MHNPLLLHCVHIHMLNMFQVLIFLSKCGSNMLAVSFTLLSVLYLAIGVMGLYEVLWDISPPIASIVF